MVTNIDTNVGRVLKALDDRRLAGDTIVDFHDGQRSRRGALQCRSARLEGVGLRRRDPRAVLHPLAGPFSRRVSAVDRIAAHIDLLPTLLDACGVSAARRRATRRQEPAASADAGCRQPVGRTGPFISSGTAATSPSPTAPSPLGPRPTSCCDANRSRAPPRNRRSSCTTWSTTRSSSITSPPSIPTSLSKMHADYLAWFKDVSATRGFAPVADRAGRHSGRPHAS